MNVVFTFFGEQVESGLRKAGGAMKAGLAKLWGKIGATVVDALAAPMWMAMGMGAGGGRGFGRVVMARPKATGLTPIGHTAQLEAEELEHLSVREPTPDQSVGAAQGRENKEDWMTLHEHDPNQPAHVRGWLKNEQRRFMRTGKPPRTPKGYVMGHGPATPAREGFDYSNATLTHEDLNQMQELARGR